MSEKTISSVSEFLEFVKSRPINTGLFQYNLWYRAESFKFEHTMLIPNTYREYIKIPDQSVSYHSFETKEKNLIAVFENEAFEYLNKNNLLNNPMSRYYLMQHYGMETRLLDWTDNALISLFFAVENDNSQFDSIIWVLDAFSLNRYTLKEINPYFNRNSFVITGFEHNKTITDYFDPDKLNDEMSKFPIAVKPPYLDQRMKNQNACFTLFGKAPDGLKSHPNKENLLTSVRIPKDLLANIKRELYLIGISYDTIYPGLDGISKKIMYGSRNGIC